MGHRVLLVDDDARVLEMLGGVLLREGYVLERGSSLQQAFKAAREQQPDVVLIDYELPDGTALDFLSELRGRADKTPVIVLTGHASYGLAVSTIKAGADNFLPKPADINALLEMLARLFVHKRNERKQAAMTRDQARLCRDPFIGDSRAIRELSRLAHTVLDSQAPVLILGETGSGKGVLARWLHEHGRQSSGAFVDLNCAGLSKELAESELFGHRRGAFTGATTDKDGLLALAHDGTLFLDEIGDLDLSVQPKLLKVLEDKAYRRLGDVQSREANVRLISATHRQLPEMIGHGSFRSDLLFRINTITFELPSLRSHKEDIVPLARHILAQIAAEQGRQLPRLSDAASQAITSYSWPGNIRELRNTLERSLIFCRGEVIDFDDVRFMPSFSQPVKSHADSTLEEVEKQHVMRALQETGGKIEAAAQRLGIARSSLYAKLKRYGEVAR